METSDYSFLPVLLKEEIYIINEKNPEQVVNQPLSEKAEPIATEKQAPFIPEKTIDQKKPDLAKPTEIKEVIVVYSGKEIKNSDFLQKILAAVNLKMNQVQLIQESNFEIEKHLPSKVLISFGAKLPVENSSQYQPDSWNGITVLNADILETIEKEVAKKKALWSALQKIFLS